MVDGGPAVTTDPVVAESPVAGVHEYAVPPEAVRVVAVPLHIWVGVLMLTVGVEILFTVSPQATPEPAQVTPLLVKLGAA